MSLSLMIKCVLAEYKYSFLKKQKTTKKL